MPIYALAFTAKKNSLSGAAGAAPRRNIQRTDVMHAMTRRSWLYRVFLYVILGRIEAIDAHNFNPFNRALRRSK